jgi:hypothetical protein
MTNKPKELPYDRMFGSYEYESKTWCYGPEPFKEKRPKGITETNFSSSRRGWFSLVPVKKIKQLHQDSQELERKTNAYHLELSKLYGKISWLETVKDRLLDCLVGKIEDEKAKEVFDAIKNQHEYNDELQRLKKAVKEYIDWTRRKTTKLKIVELVIEKYLRKNNIRLEDEYNRRERTND